MYISLTIKIFVVVELRVVHESGVDLIEPAEFALPVGRVVDHGHAAAEEKSFNGSCSKFFFFSISSNWVILVNIHEHF